MRRRLNMLVAVGSAAVLAVLVTGGCASMTSKESWTGRKIDEAIAKLGTPSNVIPADDGGKTYVWLLHRTVPVQNVTFDSQGNPVYGTRYRDSVRTLTFSVDASGTIVTWNDSAAQPSI